MCCSVCADSQVSHPTVAPAAAAAPPGLAAAAAIDRNAVIQALALDLLSTYIARDNAREWLLYARACDAAAAGTGDAKAAPLPPKTVHTDMAPARMFTREAYRRPRARVPAWSRVVSHLPPRLRPAEPQDDPAVYRAALQWFVRVLLLITTATPAPTFQLLTSGQRVTMHVRSASVWENAAGVLVIDPNPHGDAQNNSAKPAVAPRAWPDGGRPRPHHLLWINGFNARADAVRPFGPNESAVPPGTNADDFKYASGCSDAWVIAAHDLQPPLLTACRLHHVLAHALLDVPSGDPLLQGGSCTLNVEFLGLSGVSPLWCATVEGSAFGYEHSAVALLQRLVPRCSSWPLPAAFTQCLSNPTTTTTTTSTTTTNTTTTARGAAGGGGRSRQKNGHNNALMEVLRRLSGRRDSAPYLHVLQWLCSHDGGLPDDNSGIDLTERDERGRTLEEVLRANAQPDGARDTVLLWERARAIVRAGVARVHAHPARLRAALRECFGGGGGGGGGSTAIFASSSGALLSLPPPLQALVCDYVLRPLAAP